VRLAALAGLLVLELMVLSILLDTDQLVRRVGLVGLIAEWGPHFLRAVLAFVTLYTGLAFFAKNNGLQAISNRLAGVPISWGRLGGHFCAMAVSVALSIVLFDGSSSHAKVDHLAAVWLMSGTLATLLGAGAFVPLRIGLEFLRVTSTTAVTAALGSITALFVGSVGDLAWESSSGFTFQVVAVLLRPFHSNLIVDAADLTLGTSRFQVTIVSECSGLQGAGLMLVFTSVWLWLFRRECLFPRAFLLIPAGVFLTWVLNCVRIATLIHIGDAGAERVALGGFHSQAGWIAFNTIALGFAFVLQRVSWLRTNKGQSYAAEDNCSAANPTAWYLIPFLAILAVAMVARAATDGFEWLYPLRFVAAVLALWHFRHRYMDLNWRFGWTGLTVGVAVFFMWLALDRMNGPASTSGLAEGLASLSHPVMISWIIFRALASTVTVPIVEELAFRGYLLRRLISPEFQLLNAKSSTVLAIAISSVLFGILHGDRWIAGTIAGVLYAMAYRHRDRFGDAVAAHATTNAMLTVWVLFTGDWQLW
jgi:exosortase E/protease (VPEID-CTERM system)